MRDLRSAVESSLIWGQSMDSEYDIDLWTYRTNGEVKYVEALCALPEERLAQLAGTWCISEDKIFFSKALLPAHLGYVTRRGFEYW